MSEYLSKEEIKQWRRSLEKITLEEYAARLGKKIEEAKPTNDLIDIVLKGKPVVSTETTYRQTQAERLSSIADRDYEREREISPSPFSMQKIKKELEESIKLPQKTEKVETQKSEKKAPASKKTKPVAKKTEITKNSHTL